MLRISDFHCCAVAVEEYSIFAEAYPARERGKYGRKNVGISSKNAGENPAHLKSKVSWAMVVNPGLVGPKLSTEGCLAMDEQVNIPALFIIYT